MRNMRINVPPGFPFVSKLSVRRWENDLPMVVVAIKAFLDPSVNSELSEDILESGEGDCEGRGDFSEGAVMPGPHWMLLEELTGNGEVAVVSGPSTATALWVVCDETSECLGEVCVVVCRVSVKMVSSVRLDADVGEVLLVTLSLDVSAVVACLLGNRAMVRRVGRCSKVA